MTDAIVEKGRWPSHSLPDNWMRANFDRVFSNVTDNERKLKQKEYQSDGTYPVIDQGAEQIGGYTDRQELVHPGDPPFLVFGDHTRCVKFVPHSFVQGADGVKVFQPNGIDPKFAYWSLLTIRLPNRGYSRHYQFLRNSEFPLAPINEQQRIVAKIEELFSDVDAGVTALARAKANLKRYRAAVLKAAVEGKLTTAWRAAHPDVEPASKLLQRILTDRSRKWEQDQLAKFAGGGKPPPKNWQAKYVESAPPDTADLPELPAGWCWGTVSSLTSCITYGITVRPEYVDDGVPIISAREIRSGNVDIGIAKKIAWRDFENLRAKCKLKQNDILFSKTGTIGSVARIMTPDDLCVSPNVAVLSPIVNPAFLELVLRSPPVQRRAAGAIKTTAIPDLQLGYLAEFPIPLPPSKEQDSIVAEVAEKLSQIEAAEAAIDHGLARAARLRQSILKRAFSGQLVPQDPNAEPASALLELLRASEAELNSNGRIGKSSVRKAKR